VLRAVPVHPLSVNLKAYPLGRVESATTLKVSGLSKAHQTRRKSGSGPKEVPESMSTTATSPTTTSTWMVGGGLMVGSVAIEGRKVGLSVGAFEGHQ
jgi:hypothetical protein